jgi:hypothetical protein
VIATNYSRWRERGKVSWWWLAAAVALLVGGPFLLNIAGDAQVHLVIAENFANGQPFTYNPAGETVVASTSPFWTLLLTGYYWLAGRWAVLLLSLTNGMLWLAGAGLLYGAARAHWQMSGVATAAVLLLWLGHTTVVANALGGLENVLSAVQLLLLYRLLIRWQGKWTVGRSAWLGALAGWMMLTRPDGGLFGLLALGLALPGNWPGREGLRTFALHLLVMAGAAVAVLAPWYLYQYALTGRLLTDSSLARLYNGRQGSLVLVAGLLYFHPKALVSLAAAFLPLVLGLLLTGGKVASTLAQRTRDRQSAWPCAWRTQYPRTAAVALVAAGILFYSFIVGAEAFGRYFLPLYPFLFLAGVAGLQDAYRRLAGDSRPALRRKAAAALLVLACCFMVGSSSVDYYRRLGPGRFTIEQVLDVVYGPARRQYYAVNLPALLAAPHDRGQQTDALLRAVGASDNSSVSLAVTEVQLRYFLDERVELLSLDGRTSAAILAYTDPVSGVPDFEAYFAATRPDYVHARQWCAVGGWLSTFFTLAIEDNLLCRWEQQTARMAPGDSFQWQNRPVTLVAPEILRIVWEEGRGQ